jgi:hypothetical protein
VTGKLDLLVGLTFGQRVAEDEDDLSSYFVETEQWRKVVADEVDVVFGAKGAGKSAIYSTLLQRDSEMFDRGVWLLSAENPRGTPAFRDLASEPPTSEVEFVTLWKLYTVSLVTGTLIDWGVKNAATDKLREVLSREGLLPAHTAPLRARVTATLQFVRRMFQPKSIETELTFDPSSGTPIMLGSITLGEPSPSQVRAGQISVDSLLSLANEALEDSDYELWLLFDRLDVAFQESFTLEANALRALFKCYLDTLEYPNIRLKIFLRNDIWRKITEGGFREASHITRQLEISWSNSALLNLVVTRLQRNYPVLEYCGYLAGEVLNLHEQRALFDAIVPDKIDVGKNPDTFEWILGRAKDGTGTVAPREVIHLLSETRDAQIKKLERGEPEPPGTELFTRLAFREAAVVVSQVRLVQTIYAEYPEVRPLIELLRGEKTLQRPLSLAEIWDMSESDAREKADRLVEIGIFERRGERRLPEYWIPFLYRPALESVQGSA